MSKIKKINIANKIILFLNKYLFNEYVLISKKKKINGQVLNKYLDLDEAHIPLIVKMRIFLQR